MKISKITSLENLYAYGSAKVLPMKFLGLNIRRWPVDCENLENYIPQNFSHIYNVQYMKRL